MKNAFITLIVVIALTFFLSFTNSGNVVLHDEDEYVQADNAAMDTIPARKDTSMRKKGSTIPYDSFGKPKKMDTTRSK